ncbi:MAG TPA: hypothetical protein VGN83_20545 [Falsiroseomonas sp.]|jgi:hypothetical protein|nr:hypothetical protein [Falsiroseomonas sp.]
MVSDNCTTADVPVPELLRVLDSARSFLSQRDRVAAIVTGDGAQPRHLADAIDRDFALFYMERAAHALREAVAEADTARGGAEAASGRAG